MSPAAQPSAKDHVLLGETVPMESWAHWWLFPYMARSQMTPPPVEVTLVDTL